MSRIQWLGDPVADCKSDLTKQAACHAFAATLATATGSAPLGTYYKDKCLEYLCSSGSMPTPADIPPCKDDQANRDKCAAFGSALAVASGSAPLGPFYRDQCLEYLCAQGKMPEPKDMPAPPPVTPPPAPAPVPAPVPAPTTPVAPAGVAPSTPWGWIVAGTAAALGLVWAFVPQTRPWKDNPAEPKPKFKVHLERVRLDRGGYEVSGYHRGRYWGVGAPLYRYSDDSGAIDGYVRAASRTEAKERVLYQSPGMDVSFYRA